MRIRIASILACALLVLLHSCAGHRDVQPPAGGLPPFPNSRVGSLATYVVNGSDAAAKSTDALALGSDMLLPGAKDNMNWATYELRPGARPLLLEVWLRRPQTTEAWVALADFSLQRWELRGPTEHHELFALDLQRHLSETGTVHVAVVVTGSNYAVVEKLEIIEREPPVASFSVSKTRGMPSEAVTCDASASYSPDGSIVRYQWDFNEDGNYEQSTGTTPSADAYLPNPATYGTFRLRVTDDAGLQDVAEVRVSSAARLIDESSYGEALAGVKIVDGNPAVVYAVNRDGDFGLYFRRALVAEGLAWGEPVEIFNGGMSYQPAFDIIDGKPAVLYVSQGIWYIHALDSVGAEWSDPVQALPDGHFILGRNGFESINGLPAFFATTRWQDPRLPHFVIADDVNGSTWKAPVKLPIYISGSGYGGYVLTQLGEVPVCFFHDGLVRAEDPLGQSWLPFETLHNGWYPRIIKNNDRPAIVYYDHEEDGDHLYYRQAYDPEGTNWDWSPTEIFKGGGLYSYSLAIVNDYPWFAAIAGSSNIYYGQASSTTGDEWFPVRQLDVYASDTELIELPDTAGIVYIESTGDRQIWFDRLESL